MAKVTAKDAVMVLGLAIGGIVVGVDKMDGSIKPLGCAHEGY